MKIKTFKNLMKIGNCPPASAMLKALRAGKLKIMLLAICFIIFSPQEASAALILQAPKYIGLNSGLVGYWSFNGPDIAGNTAYDRSGNANNGTLTNGPVRAIGKLGQALSFDGTDDRVNISSNLGISGDSAIFSFAAWVKVRVTVPPNLGNTILSIGDTSAASQNIIYVQADDSQHFVLFRFINDSFGGGNQLGTTFVPGEWYHVVTTYVASTGVAQMFVNGSLSDSATLTTGFPVGVDTTAIGAKIQNNGTFIEFFNGSIDDVRVYNRALSADEIKRLYRIGATLKVNTSINNDSLTRGLVGYWSLNAPDIAGTTVYDRSGNAKNGSALGQDISPSGLVGWWRLDGASSGSIANGTTVGFEDASGRANNGTASNANGTGMAWTTPKIGVGAVNFDGVDDYVNAGSGSSLDITGTQLSFGAWFKNGGDNSGLDSYQQIVGRNGGGGYQYRILANGIFNTSIGLFLFQAAEGNISISTSNFSALPINTWHHIFIVYNGITVNFYLDGVLIASPAQTASITSIPTYNLEIGKAFGANYEFNGSIDDVRIYNRAVSATEVAQLYNYGLPKFAPAIGKIGQGIDSTQSYVNPGNVSSSVNSFAFWLKTASSSPTVNLLDLNASQYINIVGGTVKANGITSPSIFVDGVSGSTVNAGWHHIAVTTGTAVNASAVNLGLNATTTAPLDGALDDVRFYNRVINNDEIKRLYRIGATLKVNTDVSRDNPDLERGLVGYWSFDGKDMAGNTAYDRSGNANNGTLTNGPTRAIGKIGQALNFDGSNDYVALADTPFDFERTNSFSASGWIKYSTVGVQNMLLSKENPTSPYLGWAFYSDGDGTGLPVVFLTNSYITNAVEKLGSTNVGDNQWHHIAFTYNGNSNASGVNIYTDGVLSNGTVNKNTLSASMLNNTSLGIGSNGLGTFNNSAGKIDDVRIYNRALTSDEIKRLYNLGR